MINGHGSGVKDAGYKVSGIWIFKGFMSWVWV